MLLEPGTLPTGGTQRAGRRLASPVGGRVLTPALVCGKFGDPEQDDSGQRVLSTSRLLLCESCVILVQYRVLVPVCAEAVNVLQQ